MGLQSELRDAMDEGYDEVVAVLARHKVVPVEAEAEKVETASLLGGGKEITDFELEERGEDRTMGDVVDRQTRKLTVEALGIETVEDCGKVQDEITSHEEWGTN
ncbi:hypothetical protein BRC83_08385 [Halobacteriales archaeon QS_1_68_17]|nr:MAG: hypothetical protein BRC83_08385 [Halobacteriales archaeon QS_1_68_17]